MSFLERAIKDGYAIITGVENKKKIIYEGKIKIWYHLLNLFSFLLLRIGLWLTIYYFSPCHFIILETLGDFFEIISLIIEN